MVCTISKERKSKGSSLKSKEAIGYIEQNLKLACTWSKTTALHLAKKLLMKNTRTRLLLAYYTKTVATGCIIKTL